MIRFAVAVLAFWCVSTSEASDETSIDALGWLAGYWVGSAGDVAMEEFWTEPKGGIMLGLHRDVFPARPAFFEFLRIEQRESAVVYIASPRGEGATEFVLLSAGAAEVVFENLEHDFPQRIIYRRPGRHRAFLELGLEMSRVLPRFAGPILQGLDSRLDFADGVAAQLEREHGHLKPTEPDLGRALLEQLFEERDHLTRSHTEKLQLISRIIGRLHLLGLRHGWGQYRNRENTQR